MRSEQGIGTGDLVIRWGDDPVARYLPVAKTTGNGIADTRRKKQVIPARYVLTNKSGIDFQVHWHTPSGFANVVCTYVIQF
jgi:CubicO group peptidase (beta-lactamase class C family)